MALKRVPYQSKDSQDCQRALMSITSTCVPVKSGLEASLSKEPEGDMIFACLLMAILKTVRCSPIAGMVLSAFQLVVGTNC